METINSYILNKTAFDLPTEVAALLFPEYYTTIVCIDKNNNSFIKEWVDCTDDQSVNRFLFYQTTRELLKAFIDKRITHLEFIRRSVSDTYFLIDLDEESNYHNVLLLRFNEIPADYLPEFGLSLESEDFVSPEIVYDYFNLYGIVDDTNYNLRSNQFSNLINIHLREGEGVGFGRIDADKLGKILIGFEGLYENLAKDYYFSKNRGTKIPKKISKHLSDGNLECEVVIFESASFNVILKPKADMDGLFGDSSSDIICERALNLIAKSKNIETFNEISSQFSAYTMSSYLDFVNIVYEELINIDIKIESYKKEVFSIENLTFNEAFKIRAFYDQDSEIETDKFDLVGNFTGVNCNTGYFWFDSNDKQSYHGYLDKLISDSAYDLNFHKLYLITIERKLENKATKDSPKIHDTILAIYDYNE